MRKSVLHGAFFFALILVPSSALARAGSGQHYSSPSHSYSSPSHSYSSPSRSYSTPSRSYSGSSSRSYSSSSYSGGSNFVPPWYLDGNPIVGGLAAVLTIVVIVWANYRVNDRSPLEIFNIFVSTRNRSERRGNDRRAAAWVDARVKALKADDPEFKPDDLNAKAGRVFDRLQRGWLERDLSGARPFLSAATFQRFTVQLDLMRRQHIRNAICDWKMLDAELIGLEQSQGFDTAQIRIHAQMRDVDVPAHMPDREALARAKKVAPKPFIEVWSFLRKRGAKTRPGADLFKGRCPNCGAPFHGGASNACEFCKAVVNSGHYDWTLAEITQGFESLGGEAAVQGLAEARQADPTLNLEVIEDRASLVFWRWIEAQAKADARPLAKLAMKPFVDELGAGIAGLQARNHRAVFLDCAVGTVMTRVLRRQDGFDQAHVEVRWSARMGECANDAPPPALPTLPQRWMFVLVRKTGARPRAQNGLATDRCGNCGAPMTDDGNVACAFCGTVAGSAEHDWVLSAAMTYDVWMEREGHSAHATARRAPAAGS